MSRVFLNNNAINQKGTPLLYTDILSNRPQYGINGRLFFSTDSQQIFEDTGTSWLLLADATGSVTGYVPYVGATTNLNLGLFNITASSIVKSGGTSSQILAADGSVITAGSNIIISGSTISTSGGTVTSVAALTLGTTGTDLSSSVANSTTTPVITLNVPTASATNRGALSSADWNTFNNKASLTAFSATTPLSYNSGTGAFSIQVANTGQSGYLTNTDWNTFNGKQSALSFGNLTETSSSILNITGGTGAVIGSGTTIAVNQANSTQSGYLSSNDWNTFNNKQPQINGTGFVKATGTTISYDNSTYLTTTTAGTTYVPYTGATGAVNLGTNTLASGAITASSSVTATDNFQVNGTSESRVFFNNTTATTGKKWKWNSNTDGKFYVGIDGVFNAMYFDPSVGAATFSNAILQSVGTNNFNTTSGSTLIGTSTDNGQGKLQVNGAVTMSALSASGQVYASTATLSKLYYHVFTGAAAQTLTMPSPLSNNYQYVIINNTAVTVTIAAAASTNIITLLNTSVASIVLAANARAIFIADGNNKYYQIF